MGGTELTHACLDRTFVPGAPYVLHQLICSMMLSAQAVVRVVGVAMELPHGAQEW